MIRGKILDRLREDRGFRVSVFETAFNALSPDNRRNLKAHRRRRTAILAGRTGSSNYALNGVL